MIEKRNVLRQIKDIQQQADRLIKRKANLNEIQDFSKYSSELKNFLVNNIKDEFILNYVSEIPVLDLNDENENISGLLTVILYYFGGWLGIYGREEIKKDKALKTIKRIRDKYASAEFMLKNYFE